MDDSALMVLFVDKCGTRLLNDIIDKGTLITKLLSHVDLTPVKKHIKTKYYDKDSRKFSFDVGLMLRLADHYCPDRSALNGQALYNIKYSKTSIDNMVRYG
ncbi:MAG: hypothetical protein KAW93_04105 [Methanogenium sp.]|nr:hypothetical protein [Methanogenium sp.]